MPKFGVTADLQFGAAVSLSTMTTDGLPSRLVDALKCWDWIVNTALGKGCDALIVIGDIFDSRTVLDISVLDAVCRAFYEASRAIELLLVVGNHDSVLRQPGRNSLQVFRGHTHVYEAPTVDIANKMAFVPWYDDPEELRAAIKTVKGKAKYLFTHALIEGAVPKGKGIPVGYLSPDSFSQVLLGDVHEPLPLLDNVRYVGSPMQIDYRDAGGMRGFIVLDSDTGHLEYVENESSPRFHIIEDATVEHIEPGDYVDVKTDDPEIAAEAVEAAKAKTDRVRSRYVELDDAPPRISISTSDTHEDVLRRYCKYHEIDDDELIQLGLEFLEEAQAGA